MNDIHSLAQGKRNLIANIQIAVIMDMREHGLG